MKAKVLYHVRSCDGITLDMTEDLAAARALVATAHAALFRIDMATGHAVRTV